VEPRQQDRVVRGSWAHVLKTGTAGPPRNVVHQCVVQRSPNASRPLAAALTASSTKRAWVLSLRLASTSSADPLVLLRSELHFLPGAKPSATMTLRLLFAPTPLEGLQVVRQPPSPRADFSHRHRCIRTGRAGSLGTGCASDNRRRTSNLCRTRRHRDSTFPASTEGP
jgi:hypothetical protein